MRIWISCFLTRPHLALLWLGLFALWFEILGLYYLITTHARSEFPRLLMLSLLVISQFLDCQKGQSKFSRDFFFSQRPCSLVSLYQSFEFVFQKCVASEASRSASLPQEHPSFWFDEKTEHFSLAFSHPNCQKIYRQGRFWTFSTGKHWALSNLSIVCYPRDMQGVKSIATLLNFLFFFYLLHID